MQIYPMHLFLHSSYIFSLFFFARNFPTAGEGARNQNRRGRRPLASASYKREEKGVTEDALHWIMHLGYKWTTSEGMPRRLGFPYRYREVVEQKKAGRDWGDLGEQIGTFVSQFRSWEEAGIFKSSKRCAGLPLFESELFDKGCAISLPIDSWTTLKISQLSIT